MAVYSGPNIVTDGMILYLDKYNEESYLGEPTTNIVPNGDFASYTGGLPSGWSAYNSNAMMTAVTTDLPNGKTGIVMQAGPTWPTGSVCGVQANLGARTSGQTETVSFWYRILNTNAGTGNFWCGIWNYPDTRDIYFNTSTNTAWTYFSKSFTLTTDNSTRYYRFLTSDTSHLTGTGFTLQFWNVQYEANSHATKFVDGTRSATNGWQDLSGNDNHADLTSLTYSATNVPNTNVNDFDFNASSNYLDLGTGTSADLSVEANYGGWSAEFWVRSDDANGLQAFCSGMNDAQNANWMNLYQSKVALWNVSPGYWKYGDTVLQDNTWYQVVYVSKPGGTKYQFYVNGEAEGGDHVANDWIAVYSAFDVRYIGVYEYNGSLSGRYWNGEISIVRFYNRALEAIEVLQNFNASKGRYGL